MIDDFRKKIWDLAKDNPTMQEALMKRIMENNRYTIPIGDITEAHNSASWYRLLDGLSSLQVKDIDGIIRQIRPALVAKEQRGEHLSDIERTLRDIDILGLTFTAIEHYAHQKEQEKELEEC